MSTPILLYGSELIMDLYEMYEWYNTKQWNEICTISTEL